MKLSIEHFSDFFSAVYGVQPFSWQRRLLDEVMTKREFPSVLDMPTACGKTAIIDVATFALALTAGETERFVPRRICLVVDRRIVVDQTHERAQKLAAALCQPINATVAAVAAALKSYGGEQPLRAAFLRGATFTDQDWTEDLLQPMILSTTVDQIGSRMLFRGYGVGAGSRSVHAALLTNDALVILDEAHLSAPFLQTLNSVKFFRDNPRSAQLHARTPGSAAGSSDSASTGSADGAVRAATGCSEQLRTCDAASSASKAQMASASTVGGPFAVVSMSATPGKVPDFSLTASDISPSENPELYRRFATPRLAAFHAVKTRSEVPNRVVQLLNQAFSENPDVRCIGIVVNRVQTAREVFSAVSSFVFPAVGKPRAILLTGRARPIERDRHIRGILEQVRAGRARKRGPEAPLVVVATQCVEAGADFDFDFLLTEAAPLDALRQRFGRLNRLGHLPSSQVEILGIQDELSLRFDDPVYGAAVRNTWQFLQESAKSAEQASLATGDLRQQVELSWGSAKHRQVTTTLDLKAVSSAKSSFVHKNVRTSKTNDPVETRLDLSSLRLLSMLEAVDAKSLAELNTPRRVAPALFPSVLDLFAQTQPEPAATPDLEPYLHGLGANNADVSFVWRADLPNDVSASHFVRLVQRQIDVCRPSVGEAVQVPIYAARQWLASATAKALSIAEEFGTSESSPRTAKRPVVEATREMAAAPIAGSDLSGESDDEDPDGFADDGLANESIDASHSPSGRRSAQGQERTFWVYRNAEVSALPTSDLRPGDVVLLPATAGGCDEFGWNPQSSAPVPDLGDLASWLDRRKPMLRLSEDVHPWFAAHLPLPRPRFDVERNQWANPTTVELRRFLEKIANLAAPTGAAADARMDHQLDKAQDGPDLLREVAQQILSGPVFSDVTTDVRALATASGAEGPSATRIFAQARCMTLHAPRRNSNGRTRSLESMDFSSDESFVSNGWVTLEAHSKGVEAIARASLRQYHLSPQVADAVAMAALHHDLGKSDRRFQHMLLGSSADPTDAPPDRLLAKSKGKAARTDAPSKPIYPPRTRHELISAALLEDARTFSAHPQRGLLLHLVAAHHGWARPSGPDAADSRRTLIEASCGTERLRIFSDRHETPVGCGVTRRFCDAQQQFGWWGLAFLETLVRNADHVRSRREAEANDDLAQ